MVVLGDSRRWRVVCVCEYRERNPLVIPITPDVFSELEEVTGLSAVAAAAEDGDVVDVEALKNG